MNRRLAPSLVFAAALIVGCASQQTTTKPSPARTASAASKQWKAAQLSSYRFHYRVACFCPTLSGVVTVAGGVVTEWTPDPALEGETLRPRKLTELPTVDSLLEMAARADSEATGAVEIQYDEKYGVPMTGSIDWIEKAVDDEVGWVITDFTAL
jgi:hypothetical protein